MSIFNVTILNENGNTSIRFDDFSNTIPYPAHKIPEHLRNNETQALLKIPPQWTKFDWEFLPQN